MVDLETIKDLKLSQHHHLFLPSPKGLRERPSQEGPGRQAEWGGGSRLISHMLPSHLAGGALY